MEAGRAYRLQWPTGRDVPADPPRATKLLVGRVDVHADGLQVRLRAEGLASLAAELRQQPVLARAARTMCAESRLEGGTLVVRIPMRLGRQRGRKRILAPDGSELARRPRSRAARG